MNYKYNQDIESKLQVFEKYLRGKRYALPTIRQTRNYAGVYLAWLKSKGEQVDQVGYNKFSTFVFQLKQDESLNLTKRIILAVRHYYESLEIDKNPASGIHIRGGVRSILNDIVDFKELEELYDNYQILKGNIRLADISRFNHRRTTSARTKANQTR